MSLELVDNSEVYSANHPSGAVFKLRHWTVGMQDEVDRQCVVHDGKGAFTYLVPRERELKLELALADWSGIMFKGQEVPCNPDTKKRLPVGVILWIVREIDEKAGLRMTDEEKKN